MKSILRTDRTTETTAGLSPRVGLFVASTVVAAITVVAYVPSLSGGFVRLDDYQYVVENELVRDPSWAGVWRFSSEVRHPSTVSGYYQPLTMVSLMADALIAGAPAETIDPFIFHLTNVLLHAATSVLVFFILHVVVGGVRVPMICALIFALHPVQVESVAWISQRKTVLATALAAGAVLCYLKYASVIAWGDSSLPARGGATGQRARQDSRASGALGGGGWLAAAFVLYVLANLAKPTVMLLPLVMVLLDYWPLGARRSDISSSSAVGDAGRHHRRMSLREKWPFFVAMFVFGFIAVDSQTSAGGAGMAVARLSSAELVLRWLALLCYNVMLYAGNLVWPLHLSPFRDIPADLALTNPAVAASAIGTVVLIMGWAASYRRWPALFVGVGAAAIMLAPALGPLRFMASLVADRFLYFPMIFLLLPAAELLSRLERGFPARVSLVRAAGAVWLIPLLVLMRGQQAVWQDSKALWTHVAQSAPNLDQAPHNLALFAYDEEQYEEAVAFAERAHELDPDNANTLHLLARAYLRAGQPERAEPTIRQALEMGLGTAEGAGWVALAEALVLLGRDEEAEGACEAAIEFGYAPALCYSEVGDAAFRYAGKYEPAAKYYRRSLEYDAENVVVRWNLGTALEYTGRDADALAQYEEVRRHYEMRGVEFPRELEAAMERVRERLE